MSFTSAVPGVGSPDVASAKIHPLPLSPEPDEVSKVLPFDDAADPEAAKPVVGGAEEVAKDEMKREKRQTFDPDSDFFRNWDIFTTVLLIFTAVVTPFEVCHGVNPGPTSTTG